MNPNSCSQWTSANEVSPSVFNLLSDVKKPYILFFSYVDTKISQTENWSFVILATWFHKQIAYSNLAMFFSLSPLHLIVVS